MQIKTKKRPAVISVSISGPQSLALNLAVNNIVRNGAHIVVAAGNQGVNACNQSPGSASMVLTVGSSGSSDAMSSFSNWGTCVDIVAPGEGILSAWTGNDNAQAWMSGTSQATPHVAGVKALWLAKRNLPPNVLDAILLNSATPGALSNLQPGNVNRLLYSNPPASLMTVDVDEGVKSEDVVTGGAVIKTRRVAKKTALRDALDRLADELEELAEQL